MQGGSEAVTEEGGLRDIAEGFQRYMKLKAL